MKESDYNERNVWLQTRIGLLQMICASGHDNSMGQSEMAALMGCSVRHVKARESASCKWIPIMEALALREVMRFSADQIFGMIFAAKQGGARLPML